MDFSRGVTALNFISGFMAMVTPSPSAISREEATGRLALYIL